MVQQMRERRDLLMKNAVEVTTGVSIFKLQWVKKQTKPLRDATPLARAQISNSEEKRTDQHRETHQHQQHRNLESLPGRCGLYRWNGMRRTWTETHVQRRFLAATQAHALSCTPGRWRHGWISGSGWQLDERDATPPCSARRPWASSLARSMKWTPSDRIDVECRLSARPCGCCIRQERLG